MGRIENGGVKSGRNVAVNRVKKNVNVGQSKVELGSKLKVAVSTNARKRTDRPEVGVAIKKRSQNRANVQSFRIVSLGGLNEIGKNMTCIEFGNEILIIDCGMGFPESDLLGVDFVLPDYSYIEKNIDRVRGLVITHGHEDHIGGTPFFLKKFKVPVYGSRFAIGLIEEKLKEHGILKTAKLNVCPLKRKFKVGNFVVELINVNHSIPDAVGLAISTPAGKIVYTGDFKIDFSPVSGSAIDLTRFAELGSEGILLLMSDSTNAEVPGFTMPEKNIGASFNTIFKEAENRRIVIASFSSNIFRVQQILNNAELVGRKVAISGRSMENIVSKAIELGYLNVSKGVIIPIESVSKYPKNKIIILTTGSQGEPLSALSRMANKSHKHIAIDSEDCIIISAHPIPGNEKMVINVINNLIHLGATVISGSKFAIHTSGHAQQDELKTMLLLTKPKFFMPVHGECKHLKAHAELAMSMGMPANRIIISEIGKMVEVNSRSVKFLEKVPSGCVFVDGLGIGDIGPVVLRDRKILSEDGALIVSVVVEKESGMVVSGPEIITRGFIYVREAIDLIREIRNYARKVIEKSQTKQNGDLNEMKSAIRDDLSNFIFKKTKRSPMILPIILEI